MEIKINEQVKKVEFKEVYTRAIDRKFNELLFENVDTTTDTNWKTEFKVNPSNMQKANDYLVEAMTNLTTTELDDLAINDYNKILEKVSELKIPSKSK